MMCGCCDMLSVPARQHHLGLAEPDELGRGDDRLQSGAARAG